MSSPLELDRFVINPREDLDAEYKGWLNLSENEHRATIAKAAIALVNHGGGYIILGFSDNGDLQSYERPDDILEITQDVVNRSINRYANPPFHCELHTVVHPKTGVPHPIIVVPSTLTQPVLTSKACEGVFKQNVCFIRKPGPESAPPDGDEWRELLRRCVRANRDDLLDAIRSIVLGKVEPRTSERSPIQQLQNYCLECRVLWEELTSDFPDDAPQKFPYGYYEIGFSLIGAEPADGVVELQERLSQARRIRLTGWPVFIEMTNKPEWKPKPVDDGIQAWIGDPEVEDRWFVDPAHCDFWRVVPGGNMYLIRGYGEDSQRNVEPGKFIDIPIPIWRVGEALLFANRFADTYKSVESIAVWCRFSGLKGRRLTFLTGRRLISGNYASTDNEYVRTIEVTQNQIQDNLAEIIYTLLKPLYAHFDFFKLPFELVEKELEELRRSRG